MREGEQVITHAQEAREPLRGMLLWLEHQSMLLVPIFVGGKFWGNIGLDSCRSRREWNATEAEVLRTFASVIGVVILRDDARLSLEKAAAKLREAMTSTVEALACTLERRDPYTAGHQRAVAKLATAIAARLGVAAADLDGISLAAVIHDIGKIQVPSEIQIGRASCRERV